MRQYWFGEGVFTSDWLKKHFDSTMAALDERFHPEDHVDVDTRSAFDGLRRNALWRESLALHLSEILDQHVRGPEGDPTVEAKFTALATAVETFRGLDADIQLPAELPFPTQTWIDVVSNVRDAAHAASQSLRSVQPSASASGSTDVEEGCIFGESGGHIQHDFSYGKSAGKSSKTAISRKKITPREPVEPPSSGASNQSLPTAS